MDLEVLGWPTDGPKLRLDHEQFAYAGKFVMTDTGKAVGRERGEAGDGRGREAGDSSGRAAGDGDDIVAAASFSPDRTDGEVLRIRYITVRADERGEGVGPTLADFVTERAFERGFERVKIAVNNPFAYEAMYRAGFAFTGEETGLAELVLARPAEGTTAGTAVETARKTAEKTDEGTTTETAGTTAGTYHEGLQRFAERDLAEDERTFVSERLDERSAPNRTRREP